MNFYARVLSVVLTLGLGGCVVPLKTPPIQSVEAERPHVNFSELEEFAQAAAHAYDDAITIEKTYGANNVIVRDLSVSQTRYFIFLNHKNRTQTIAIRGTANQQNTWVDLEAIKILDPKLKIFVHKGFQKATRELLSDIGPFLQADYKTRITGHSLGGAMACLLMLHGAMDGWAIDQVLTFGQPKVTNEEGAQAPAGVPYFRIINGNDLVAQVPPSNVIYDFSGPYQHFGPEIVLGDGAWTYSTEHIPRDLVTNGNWKNVDLEHGTDHQMANYLKRIEALQ